MINKISSKVQSQWSFCFQWCNKNVTYSYGTYLVILFSSVNYFHLVLKALTKIGIHNSIFESWVKTLVWKTNLQKLKSRMVYFISAIVKFKEEFPRIFSFVFVMSSITSLWLTVKWWHVSHLWYTITLYVVTYTSFIYVLRWKTF